MPIIKSAKKRVRVAEKAAIRNRSTKRSLKSAVKTFQAAMASGDAKKVSEALNGVNSAIDTAAKKNLWHKNKVARKKSQLNKQAKALGNATPVAKKPAAKRAASAKKTPAKKPVASKTTLKK